MNRTRTLSEFELAEIGVNIAQDITDNELVLDDDGDNFDYNSDAPEVSKSEDNISKTDEEEDEFSGNEPDDDSDENSSNTETFVPNSERIWTSQPPKATRLTQNIVTGQHSSTHYCDGLDIKEYIMSFYY